MMLEGGKLEMAHQTACRFLDRMAHQSFGGVASTYEEGARIAEAQKANPHADIIFLEHHGVSIGGPTVALAFDDLYYLERACRQQILAQSTGLPLSIMAEAQAKETARSWMQGMAYNADKHFEALMRIHGL
jgi:ribulose-5-phosphate 4-epimerase/fuculose-1-phosphate aldolase